MISGLKEAVYKHTGQIEGAYSFILDGSVNEFVYTSENSTEIEIRILALHQELNFGQRSDEAQNNVCQIICDKLNRFLIIRKLATNLYLGICVEKDAEKLNLAKQALAVDFRL